MRFLVLLILFVSNSNACILKTRSLKELPIVKSVIPKKGTIIRTREIAPFTHTIKAKIGALCLPNN